MCVRLYIYVCIALSLSLSPRPPHIHACVYIYIYIYMCVYIHTCIKISTYMCMRACMHACMCLCDCMCVGMRHGEINAYTCQIEFKTIRETSTLQPSKERMARYREKNKQTQGARAMHTPACARHAHTSTHLETASTNLGTRAPHPRRRNMNYRDRCCR